MSGLGTFDLIGPGEAGTERARRYWGHEQYPQSGLPLPVKETWCHLGADQLDRLDHACLIVHAAFEGLAGGLYLVGSCLTRPAWRDVDLRLILPDDVYAAMFAHCGGHHRTNAFWSLLCASVSEYLRRLTDLPIDFQIQSMSDANGEAHSSKRRVPLGMYPIPPEPQDS